MATKLKRLTIDRVDLVDKGANPDAHIVLFKREVTKLDTQGTPLTTQEILNHDARCEAWRDLRWAFMNSLDSIMEYATPDEQAALLLTSVEEFATNARVILADMALPDDTYKRALTGVTAVEKAGRVIAGQRLQRLKQAVMALQNIITEAEPTPTTKGTNMADTLEGVRKRAELAEAEVQALTKRATDAETEATSLKAQVVTLEKRQAELVAEVEKLQPEDIWKGVSPQLRERIEKAENEVKKRDCIGQVRKYDKLPMNPDDHWSMFDFLNSAPEDVRKKVYALFDSHQELARSSAVMKQQGSKGGGSESTDTWGIIESKAQELVTKGLAKTLPLAIDAVIQQEPELYANYQRDVKGA